ncbi:MAG TPA: SMP-30/gluconolactonase/LRE family protein [Pirellulales bacterium]|jgi:sugar lactone lactonase YvrE
MSQSTPTGMVAPNAPSDRSAGRIARRLTTIAVIAVALPLLYLAFWPSPIDPVAYDPPPAPPLSGPVAPNNKLQSAVILFAGQVDGPEDVEIASDGRIFAGLADGRIIVATPRGAEGAPSEEGAASNSSKGDDYELQTFVNTGGRPVGLAFAPDGNLIVADALRGLLSINPQSEIAVLVGSAGDTPLGFTDDVTVASDGLIYFSDASSKFGPDEYLYDMLEGRPHGRLLRYDPQTKKTSVLMDELCFANGVALSEDEDFLLINETYHFCIHRYWLKGEKAGTHELFVENLPGYPDNITADGHGGFWLALFTVRNPTGDWLSPRPFFKQATAKLPRAFWPRPQPYAFVIKLNREGEILGSLQDPTGKHLREVTSAVEHEGYLYLGSLHNDRIGKYKLP